MLFHTLEFSILFLLVFPFAVSKQPHLRQAALLMASYIFYMWFSVPLVSLLIFSALLDFYIGKHIHRTDNLKRRKILLLCSLAGNLGILFFFKYFNFFCSNVNSIFAVFFNSRPIPYAEIILPLGISFYTFQTLSYTIDIYRNKIDPTDSFLTFALYVSFFPQLVAGPIVRASCLIPQLTRGPHFEPGQFHKGMGLIVYGLVKKVVIADNLAPIADQVFSFPSYYSGFDILLGVYAFAFQIYCDFSGYTDMARGVGFLLGYDIGLNFNFPYFSKSVRDFWRRWHISLSTWLKDYLYIPLGGNRGTFSFYCRNILLTMLLGGLWHGAKWTFVIWGGIHAIWIITEQTWNKIISQEPSQTSRFVSLLKIVITFHVVCLTWIFFRADTIPKALELLSQLLKWDDSFKISLMPFSYILLLLCADYLWDKTRITQYLGEQRFFYWLAASTGMITYILFGNFGGEAFVYFQF